MTTFTAHDSAQRRHLLATIEAALESPLTVEHVARRSYEGEGTSVFVFSFYRAGAMEGLRSGRRRGRDEAFDHVYGDKPADVVARARARTAAKHARRRNRKAKR